MTDDKASSAKTQLSWGINLMPDAPVSRVTEVAQIAENLGFESCWLYDEGLATRDLYVALTAIALSTSTLKIGPGVTNPYTRHASVAAAATASLNELSGGRAFMGFGAGGSLTLGPIGIPRARPNAMLRETISACRALFSGDRVDMDGELVTLNQAHLEFGDPSIPIWFAGRGPKMLRTAAELADGISFSHIHCDFLGENVAAIRETASEFGNEIKLAYSSTLVTTDEELEHVREHMSYRLVDSPAAVKSAIGLKDSDAKAISNAMSDGLAAAARLIKDDWVLPFVVHGTAEDCAKQIAKLYLDTDFSEFTVPITNIAEAEQTMNLAADIAKRAEQHL